MRTPITLPLFSLRRSREQTASSSLPKGTTTRIFLYSFLSIVTIFVSQYKPYLQLSPLSYLPGLRALCDKYGILLVCDEVMAGLGRTGEWFAVDNWKVVPDIITMAKGLTSAYLPLGCVAVSSKIAHAFDEKPFPGGLTYNGHPMCLAAAVATLKVSISKLLLFRRLFTNFSTFHSLSHVGIGRREAH